MSHSPSTSVGTQEERDLDTRLNNAILDSSSLIAQAMQQLAKPCIAPDDETDNEDEISHPADLAIEKSNVLLEEARDQLKSPTSASAPIELTESELAEKKAAEAWSHTYRHLLQTNDTRSNASQDFLGTILKDIEEVDENGELPKIFLAAPPKRTNDDFVPSEDSIRDEKRAKRASRLCAGPRVAAVVAKIEAIDDVAAPSEQLEHIRNGGVRSFGK